MSAFPGPNNPFVYAQFRLNGGWKGAFMIGGIYAAIIGSLIMMSTVNNGGTRSPFAAWPQILLVLQMVALFVVGLSRVDAAIRGDVNTRMIESHRLMPTHPLAAIAGYVAGGSIFGVILAVVNVLLGVGCCAAGGGEVGEFVLANLGLGLTAALVWFVAAHLAFTSRFGLLLLTAVSGVAFGFGNPLARALPGLGLLTAVVTGALARDAGSTNAYAVSLVALVLIAALSCRAAMRLYRSSEAIGMTWPLGLGLLGVWTGLSIVAFGFPQLVYPSALFPFRNSGADVPSQIVGTTILGMLVSTVPIAAACRAARDRRFPPILVPLSAAVLVAAGPRLAFFVHRANAQPPMPYADNVTAVAGLTFVVVAAFAAAVTLLAHWAYRRRISAWPLAFLWIIAVWVGPLIVGAVMAAMEEPLRRGDVMPRPPEVLSLSPIGALVSLWSRPDDERPYVLIVAQVLLLVFPALLYLSPPRRSKDREPVEVVEAIA